MYTFISQNPHTLCNSIQIVSIFTSDEQKTKKKNPKTNKTVSDFAQNSIQLISYSEHIHNGKFMMA